MTVNNTDSPDDGERTKLRAIGDGAACAVGKSLEGVGYCAGRAAPTMRRIRKAIVETKTAKFVYEHYRKGFESGEAAAIEAAARRQARRWMATGDAALREFAEQLLSDIAKFTGKGVPDPA